MKIYINDVKIQTKILERTLYKTMTYTFTSNRFKNRAQQSIRSTEDQLKIAKNKLTEAVSELGLNLFKILILLRIF